MISSTVTDWIYAHHSHRITQWNQTILNPPELEKYAEVVFNKGAPLSNCFGFVDGTNYSTWGKTSDYSTTVTNAYMD